MASGANNKIKVVWLCHLNNRYITNKLGVNLSDEFAPWISSFAEIFEKFNNAEVHIVSPHSEIIKNYYFRNKNIHYHFFPYTIPILPKRIFNKLHFITNYILIKQRVKKIINRINPDLIHLFGTENTYFTSSILQFKNIYPVLITVQGFIYYITTDNKEIRKRKAIEIEIIKKYKNFGVRDEEMKTLLKAINPNIRFFHHDIAPYIPKIDSSKEEEKTYDIIYFARVTKQKGIEDLFESLIAVKKEINNIKLGVIGSASGFYYELLKRKARDLMLTDNIFFLGSRKTIDEVHEVVSKSRITVLPTHVDTIPGTIIESMLIGIPCISYAVGGIPTLNHEYETIKLVQKGNIEELSTAIIELLSNIEKRELLSAKAKAYATKRWNDSLIYDDLISAYKKIIECQRS